MELAAVDSGAETAGAEPGDAEIEGEGSGGAATGGAGSGGAASGGAGSGGSGGAASGGADFGGAASPSGGGVVGDPAGDPGVGQPPQPDLLETLSPQAIRAWIVRRGSPGGGGYGLAGAGAASPGGTAGTRGATGAGGTGAASAGGTGGAAGAGGAGATSLGGATGAGAAGLGGARTGAAGAGGVGAAGTGGAGTAGAGGTGGAAGAGGARAGAGGAAGAGGPRGTRATGAGGAGAGAAGAAGPGGARTRGTGATGAGGASRAGGATRAAGTGGTDAAGAGGAGAGGDAGARGAGGAIGANGTGGAGGTAGARGAGASGARGAAGARGAGGASGAAGPAPRRLFFCPQPQSSLLPPDSVLHQVLSLPSSTGLTPPLLCPPTDQSQPQLLPGSPLPAPAPHTEVTRSLTERREPETRASTPVRARRVARPRPPVVLGTHGMALRSSFVPQRVVLPGPPVSSLPHVPDPESDLARAASPTVTHLLATVVTDPDFESTTVFSLVTELVDFAARSRLDYVASLVTERSRVSYSSQWQTATNAEMASWKSTGTYVDDVPPGTWIFRGKRPPGSPPAFKARYIARGFCQQQGVNLFQTFSPTPKMTTIRVLLHVAAHRDYELHSLDFSTV
ncbi:unnamed protein product [Closterium sp. NIES-65]|nr:unnamed protein product [Closterium sp. NIES-65]